MDTFYLFQDRDCTHWEQRPCDKGLDILNRGCHMYGYALLPGGRVGERHPCVIMLHGLPGYTTNHDLAQALRRMGFVVLNPFYRGAWGSEGYFTLSGMAEDASAVAQWAGSSEASEVYGIDPRQIFLVGISMGGWAALNALGNSESICGAVVLAPGDIPYLMEQKPDMLQKAHIKYGCLKLSSPEALMADAKKFQTSLSLETISARLQNKHIYFLGGSQDTAIPPNAVLLPLWESLKNRKMTKHMHCELLDAGHSFAECRLRLIQLTGQWLAGQVRKTIF